MIVTAEHLGKRFNREWIFKDFSYTFRTGQPCAITGPNGSGKSTLLQILSGVLPSSCGKVQYNQEQIILPEDIFRFISLTTPYQEIIEEFTLGEFITFHTSFKPFVGNLSPLEFAKLTSLEPYLHKEIRNFSSGMKQRVKLGLSLYSDCPIILLDEPTSNLDNKGIDWYLSEVAQVSSRSLVIVCSNQGYEYSFCNSILSMENYK